MTKRSMIEGRLQLLRLTRSLHTGTLVVLLAVISISSLVPVGTALALAALISRVHGASADHLMNAATAPLLAFAVIMLIGHLTDALTLPLYYQAQWQIDGAHRARLARLTASGRSIEALERPRVQSLIREARADSENWSERTPGEGALSLLLLIGRGVGVIGAAAVLVRYSWWLVPLIALPVVLLTWLNRRINLAWLNTWRAGIDANRGEAIWKRAVMTPAEGKEVRIFGLAGHAVDRIEYHQLVQNAPVWAVSRRFLVVRLTSVLIVLGPLLVAYLAVAVSAARGNASIGVATAVFAAASSIFTQWAGDPRSIVGGAASLAAFEQLKRELDGLPPVAAPAGGAARPVEGHSPALVRFENVSFTYPDTERKILDELDLEIRPGELLAIVGLNGAGKSTMIKLLAALYEPTSGKITAAGVDIAEIGARAWRRRIAVVFQDFVRYHLTAADNVALGNAAVPFDSHALEAASRDSGFDDVLARLADGWQTPLARTRTDGVDLSGGQWQQVVLARALYAVRTGAEVLVLDEPTAHLDVRTEFDVFERLAAHKGDAAVVLISHRLSTVRRADRIVLLDGGRITEAGTHDELIALGGGYAQMFAIQAERFTRGYEDRIEQGDLV